VDLARRGMSLTRQWVSHGQGKRLPIYQSGWQ
jgi:hypothetical protein